MPCPALPLFSFPLEPLPALPLTPPGPPHPTPAQEHLHAAWLLPPTACFVCALVAPFLDARYAEAAYLWFALAVALAVPLYVLTFNKAVLFNEADDRNRPLK